MSIHWYKFVNRLDEISSNLPLSANSSFSPYWSTLWDPSSLLPFYFLVQFCQQSWGNFVKFTIFDKIFHCFPNFVISVSFVNKNFVKSAGSSLHAFLNVFLSFDSYVRERVQSLHFSSRNMQFRIKRKYRSTEWRDKICDKRGSNHSEAVDKF